jgi:hypothetical protein
MPDDPNPQDLVQQIWIPDIASDTSRESFSVIFDYLK